MRKRALPVLYQKKRDFLYYYMYYNYNYNITITIFVGCPHEPSLVTESVRACLLIRMRVYVTNFVHTRVLSLARTYLRPNLPKE